MSSSMRKFSRHLGIAAMLGVLVVLVTPSTALAVTRSSSHEVAVRSGSAPPLTTCTLGTETTFNGQVWSCQSENGQLVLVSKGRQPSRDTMRLTTSEGPGLKPSVVNLVMTGNTEATSCTARHNAGRRTWRMTKSIVNGSASWSMPLRHLRPSVYNVIVTCNDGTRSDTSFVVGSGGSLTTRMNCLDAWHDRHYANTVPGYTGTRLDPNQLASIEAVCQRMAPLTDQEKNADAQDYFNTVGQLVQRVVRRVSTERGIPPCQAVYEIFKAVNVNGELSMDSSGRMNNNGPVAGYAADSYFPILHRQWTDGPFRMKIAVGCGGPEQSLWLIDQKWTGIGNPDAYPPTAGLQAPASEAERWMSHASTCIVWGSAFGNDGVGGVGRVFATGNWDRVSMPNDVRDCGPRASGSGLYQHVADAVLTPLP